MALGTKARPIGPLQDALTTLEESQKPIEEQVTEACRILQLEISALATTKSLENEIQRTQQVTAFLGREQWVLRWLLGRFQTKGSAGSRARCNPEAWRLLEVLIHRIPLTNIARHLNTYKFLEIFEGTLQDLISESEESGNNIADEASESSSTLMESPGITPVKPSRKRKRSGSIAPAYQPLIFEERTTAPFRVLAKLLALTKGAPYWKHRENDGYEREYMISVLRSEPATAARILRLSLEILYAILEGKETIYGNLSTISSILEDSLDLWNYRSGMIDDVGGNASNKTFATYCMVPTMVLLAMPRTSPAAGTDFSRMIALLEHHIAFHVLVPARSAFVKPRGSSGTSQAIDLQRDSDILGKALAPLRSSISAISDEGRVPTFQSLRAVMLMKSVPQFFALAIRYCSWKEPKSRAHDTPWLEALFKKIAEAVGIWTSPESEHELSKQQLSILEDLFQVAINNNIRLGTTLLRTIAINHCGLFSEDEALDRWRLWAQLLKLDANVFLIPSHEANIPEGARALANPLLEALFAKIALVAGSSDKDILDIRRCIQQQILLPVMRELANARALSTFFRHWHHSLSVLEERRLSWLERNSPSHLLPLTILETEDNSELLRELLETALTTKQIARDLEFFKSTIEPLSKSLPVQKKAQTLASLVIIEAVLKALSRDDSISSLREDGSALYYVVQQQIKHGAWPKWHRWRVWRVLAQINTLWPDIRSSGQRDKSGTTKQLKTQYTFKRARKILDGCRITDEQFSVQAWGYREAYEALEWTFGLAERFTNSNDADLEEAVDIVEQSLVLLAESLKGAADQTPDSNEEVAGDEPGLTCLVRWSGRIDGLAGRSTFLIALAARLISRYPFALSLSPSTVRRKLFHSLYLLAIGTDIAFKIRETFSDISFSDVWESVLESEYVLNHAEVKDDLVEVLLVESRSKNVRVIEGISTSNSEAAVRNFLKLPVVVLKRKDRETILDLLVERCLESQTPFSSHRLSSYMSLMVKLMRYPNATANLTTDPSAIWNLAANCERRDEMDQLVFVAFEELVSLTLGHLLSTKEQERSSRYLEGMISRLWNHVDRSTSLLEHPLTLGLLKRVLAFFWLNIEVIQLPSSINLSFCRTKYVENLIGDLRASQGKLTTLSSLRLDINSELLLDAFAEIPGLDDLAGSCSESAGINLALTFLKPFVYPEQKGMTIADTDKGCLPSSLPTSLFKLFGRVESRNKQLLLRSIPQLLNRDLAPLDRVATRSIIEQWFLALEDNDKLSFLRDLADMMQDNGSDTASLLCMRIVLSVNEDHSTTAKEALSHVYHSLLNRLQNLTSVRQYRLVMDCIETMVLTKNWALSQWEIDMTLGCVVFMASSHSPELPTKHAGFIYSRLCGLMSDVLTVHRLKLRGRFHIIIPVLQSLLRCFFIARHPSSKRPTNRTTRGAHPSSSSSSSPSSTPPWLPPDGLFAPQATAYARLLTSLCDPTVSSVATTNPRNRRTRNLNQQPQPPAEDPLTPATDLARRMAGQHLPYLLMDYLDCRLRYSTATSIAIPSQAVKEALLPGIYAVLDVLTPDTRRMLNAALDASARALFRVLWADYQRFRTWNER